MSNGPICSYTVFAVLADPKTCTTPSLSCHLSGLEGNNQYQIPVEAPQAGMRTAQFNCSWFPSFSHSHLILKWNSYTRDIMMLFVWLSLRECINQHSSKQIHESAKKGVWLSGIPSPVMVLTHLSWSTSQRIKFRIQTNIQSTGCLSLGRLLILFCWTLRIYNLFHAILLRCFFMTLCIIFYFM